MTNYEKLKSELQKVEEKLNKCRTSAFQDGRTQKAARKSRNWDYYAERKRYLRSEIALCEDAGSSDMCDGCDCWKRTRENCT